MYVTKQQVEDMIREAMANGGVISEPSDTQKAMARLAESFKDYAEQATTTIAALRREVSDQSRRLGALEELGALAAPPNFLYEKSTGPGLVQDTAPQAAAFQEAPAPAPQPEAATVPAEAPQG